MDANQTTRHERAKLDQRCEVYVFGYRVGAVTLTTVNRKLHYRLDLPEWISIKRLTQNPPGA